MLCRGFRLAVFICPFRDRNIQFIMRVKISGTDCKRRAVITKLIVLSFRLYGQEIVSRGGYIAVFVGLYLDKEFVVLCFL